MSTTWDKVCDLMDEALEEAYAIADEYYDGDVELVIWPGGSGEIRIVDDQRRKVGRLARWESDLEMFAALERLTA